jgi:selenoprotein W-related protein
MSEHPRIAIRYCTQCRWLLRAAWMAQELLNTFVLDLGEVALIPGTGGVFEVWAEDMLIWSRAEQGRFPEITELKRLVRDQVVPGKSLGHIDRKAAEQGDAQTTQNNLNASFDDPIDLADS